MIRISHEKKIDQQLDDEQVRTIALGSTEWLARGRSVKDTDMPITVPVGAPWTGVVINVIGEPIDD